jgi:tRNA G10  N-methylase Trm11
MQKYLSTFPKGLKNIVVSAVSKYIPDIKVLALKPNQIIYKTNIDWHSLQDFPFWDTTFYIFKFWENNNPNLKNIFNWALQSNNLWKQVKTFEDNKYSYRIIESRPGYKPGEFNALRNRVEQKLQSKGINIDKGHPDYELRLIEETNLSYIGIRISKPPEYKEVSKRNSLPQSIATFMIYLSKPEANDIVLDPFCGGGIIPILRSQLEKYKQIYAADKNLSYINKKLQLIKTKPQNINLIRSNFRNLKDKISIKVDKIVTDPPWGYIEEIENIESFYNNMLQIFTQVLKPGGKVVLLTNRKEIIENSIKDIKELSIQRKLHVEVSGRKAFIYIFNLTHDHPPQFEPRIKK